MKRIIALLLALAIAFSVIPFPNATATTASLDEVPKIYAETKELLKNADPEVIDTATWMLLENGLKQYGNLADLPWEQLTGTDRFMDYMRRSADQFMNGNFSSEVTLLGTTMKIGVSLLGVDLPFDFQDLTYDFLFWENSLEHIAYTTVDIIAILPGIGSLKEFDEAIILIRGGSESLRVLAKRGQEIVRLGTDMVDAMGEILKDSENLDEAADSLVEMIKNGEHSDLFKTMGKAAKEADKAKKILVITEILNTTNRSDEAIKAITELVKNKDTLDKTSFVTFASLKKYLSKQFGKTPDNMAWHHIVEQHQGWLGAVFGLKTVNCVNNVILIPDGAGSIHRMITAIYGTNFGEVTGNKTLRKYLADLDFDEQFRIGLEILQLFGEVKCTFQGWVFTPYKWYQ